MTLKPKHRSPSPFGESPTVRVEPGPPRFARTERLAPTPADGVVQGGVPGDLPLRARALNELDQGNAHPPIWPPKQGRDSNTGGHGPRPSHHRRLIPGGLSILLILVAGVIAIGPARMFASAHDGKAGARHTANQTTPASSPATTPAGTTPTTAPSTQPPATAPGNIANMQFTAQSNSAGPSQQGLQGADIEIRWNWLEPTAPVNGVHQYNWARFDGVIARWHAAGKRVMLLVHYTNYTGSCSGEQEMPAWEIARIQHTCDSAYGVITPNYFDPTFIGDLQTFVRAIGAHYAASPYQGDIAYVRVGTGIGGEEIPNRGGPSNAPVWSQVQQWGYSPIAWRNWIEARLLDYKAAFPYTTVLNSVNTVWATDPNPDPTTGMRGLTIQAEIAYWAAAHGLGIGCQTLSPGFDYAKIKEITSYIRAHWPQTLIEFQTKTGVASLAEVQGDIQTAYCYGAKAIEWYANVANTAAYQQAFQSWQQLTSGKAPASAISCP